MATTERQAGYLKGAWTVARFDVNGTLTGARSGLGRDDAKALAATWFARADVDRISCVESNQRLAK